MQIEKIFGEIPIFHDIKIDKILFESSYPILFTCIENRNMDRLIRSARKIFLL